MICSGACKHSVYEDVFIIFVLDSLHSTETDPGISKRGRGPGAVGFLVGHLNCGTANLSPQPFTI